MKKWLQRLNIAATLTDRFDKHLEQVSITKPKMLLWYAILMVTLIIVLVVIYSEILRYAYELPDPTAPTDWITQNGLQ